MKFLLTLLVLAQSLLAETSLRQTPINHFQVIGTHNSYHLAPHEAERKLIALKSEAQVESLEYSHPPLRDQFAAGIRQIELDCFADPEGGRYARPAAQELAEFLKIPFQPQSDPEGLLEKPGTKILHFPHVDFRTTVLTLQQALSEVRDWSRTQPDHFPLFVLLELKGSSEDWQPEALAALEEEILAIIPREHLLTPDDVRGQHETLRAAVLSDGWPSLAQAQGKIMLALDNTNQVLTHYLAPDETVKGRLLFPSCPDERHPAAAWFKMNDPINEFALIKARSQKGFLIRTRADAGTREARANDTTRRERAFASGAQYISTDFPTANPAFSDYAVTLPGGSRECHYFRPQPPKGREETR
ncbi:Ca2+-dependent phosphoinositide-specific phospholipase C [Roseibacillus ishigakijimensis]|uniref:Phosphoinositide phospholipase C, Ca2+-dependent n=1 Tax=Roseibacillus ishigakijimensis TaxID=454146 RepID=A0A934RJA0_9BACT|nr:Ca2+-dependent phosphoinositide-specific phospholipase C [Roseibacillus ishigakijimensis]MBK1832687.1 hypothetical protein [Roseibacillus ishigakijimensis]